MHPVHPTRPLQPMQFMGGGGGHQFGGQGGGQQMGGQNVGGHKGRHELRNNKTFGVSGALVIAASITMLYIEGATFPGVGSPGSVGGSPVSKGDHRRPADFRRLGRSSVTAIFWHYDGKLGCDIECQRPRPHFVSTSWTLPVGSGDCPRDATSCPRRSVGVSPLAAQILGRRRNFVKPVHPNLAGVDGNSTMIAFPFAGRRPVCRCDHEGSIERSPDVRQVQAHPPQRRRACDLRRPPPQTASGLSLRSF